MTHLTSYIAHSASNHSRNWILAISILYSIGFVFVGGFFQYWIYQFFPEEKKREWRKKENNDKFLLVMVAINGFVGGLISGVTYFSGA